MANELLRLPDALRVRASATPERVAHDGTPLTAPETTRYANRVGARWGVTNGPAQLAGLDLAACWTLEDLPRDAACLPDATGLDPDLPADIIGTSGTTGYPKGVVNTHVDLLAGLDATATSRSRSLLHALPFTGFGGCHAVMLSPLRLGRTIYTQPSFDAEGFLELVADRPRRYWNDPGETAATWQDGWLRTVHDDPRGSGTGE